MNMLENFKSANWQKYLAKVLAGQTSGAAVDLSSVYASIDANTSKDALLATKVAELEGKCLQNEIDIQSTDNDLSIFKKDTNSNINSLKDAAVVRQNETLALSERVDTISQGTTGGEQSFVHILATESVFCDDNNHRYRVLKQEDCLEVIRTILNGKNVTICIGAFNLLQMILTYDDDTFIATFSNPFSNKELPTLRISAQIGSSGRFQSVSETLNIKGKNASGASFTNTIYDEEWVDNGDELVDWTYPSDGCMFDIVSDIIDNSNAD